jgi:hypothetical protein
MLTPGARTARWIFAVAAIYGIPVMLAMFLAPAKILEGGPSTNRPEWYYGFAAIRMAWQMAFVAIARDPVRLRPVMPMAICEKLFFLLTTIPLLARGETPPQMIPAVVLDGVFGVAFVVAFVKTRPRSAT